MAGWDMAPARRPACRRANLGGPEESLGQAGPTQYNRLAASVFHPEATMLDEQIEAVFENGVFRPLGPVDLPGGEKGTS